MMFSRVSPNKKRSTTRHDEHSSEESKELHDNNMPKINEIDEASEKTTSPIRQTEFENQYLLQEDEEEVEPSNFGYPSNRIISNGRVIANRTWEGSQEEMK